MKKLYFLQVTILIVFVSLGSSFSTAGKTIDF